MKAHRGIRALALALCLGAGLGAAPSRGPSPEDIARLEQAVAAAPQDAEARRRLGDALFRAGRAFDSMKALNPERSPDSKWAVELRKAADSYLRSGRTDAARAALKQALERAR